MSLASLRLSNMSLTSLRLPKLSPARMLHTTAPVYKVQAGKYKVTLDQSKPLTYEMALSPQKIGIHKSFNSFNSGQLEDTFGVEKWEEKGGVNLSYKMFMEDMFIRKFMKGTWSGMFLSEIIIKRQHNTIRVAALIKRNLMTRKFYFLIGYTEEMLGQWLKCPVKLEMQIVDNHKDVVYKYI